MLAKRGIYPFILLTLVLIGTLSCRKNVVDNEPPSADSSYFSVRQFIKDQIDTHYGKPYSLYRIAYLDDERDSTVVSFLDLDWSSILGTFSAADISPRKYLGKYDFSVSDESITGYRGYTYTSTDPEAFTRMFQINTDPTTNLIKSLYIETEKHDFFRNKTQKLLYIPLRIIQIQETEGSLFGKARNLRVDYRFMEEDEREEM